MTVKPTIERLRHMRYKAHAALVSARAKNRPFPDSAKRRLLLISDAGRIPQSQIFPFHFYSDDLYRKYQASVREVSLQHLMENKKNPVNDATAVAFQSHYDIADDDLDALIQRLKVQNPNASFIYLDWSAPTDLRNADRLSSRVQTYVKKHVLRDRNQYGKTTLGDTNLADHYSRRLGLNDAAYNFPIPAGFMEKLLVGPSFITAPGILHRFRQGFEYQAERPIDLHARFMLQGSAWYEAMRNECASSLSQLKDLNLAADECIPLHKFMAELGCSKLCFSPFGYGEVCWRDFESVMAGSVLVKPDMSHIETHPDIFRPWETYVPVRWDLTDLESTVRNILKDPVLLESIAERAHSVLHDYVCSDDFAVQMEPLFIKNGSSSD